MGISRAKGESGAGETGRGWYVSSARNSSKSSSSSPQAVPQDAREGKDRTAGDVVTGIFSSLIAGVLLYGGLGWLLGRWLGNPAAWTAAGVLFGAAGSLLLVWIRLGNQSPDQHDELARLGRRVGQKRPPANRTSTGGNAAHD